MTNQTEALGSADASAQTRCDDRIASNVAGTPRLRRFFQVRYLATAALPVAAIVAIVILPSLVGTRLRDGLDGVRDANPNWLWLGGCAFAAGLACSALAWRSALAGLDAHLSRYDAVCRYLTGSLGNSLLPGKVGTALRLALYARAVPGEGRLLAVGGAGIAIAAGQGLWAALLLLIGAVLGVVPVWPVVVLGALVVLAAVVAATSDRIASHTQRRITHALDAFRAIGRRPRLAAGILGWTGAAQVARIAAATALLAGLGVERPLLAALLVLPAVALAGSVPIVPGNVGVSSAAVAMALAARDIPGDVALSAGVAFGAVEFLTSLLLGTAGALGLVRASGTPRRLVTAGALAGSLAVATAFGVTVVLPAVELALG